MGLLYETLIQMVEAGPLQQPASSATPTADEVSAAQQRFLKAEQAMKTASPQQKTAATEEYRSAWFDYDGKRKAAEAADTQVVQNNQNVRPGGANKDSQPQQPQQQQPQQSALPPDQVKILQKALIAKGQILPPSKLAKDGVDGILGKNTFNAIMALIVGKQPATPTAPAATPAAAAPKPAVDPFAKPAMSTESVLGSDPTLARIVDLARR